MARVRTLIVGDIHGMLSEFRELMEKCDYRQGVDRLILVGDLVDRGPDSAGVIRYAKDIGAELTIGNHDWKYIRYHRHELKKTHKGRRHYRNPIKLPPEKLEVWESLTTEDVEYLMEGRFCVPLWEYGAIIVHAGVLPGPHPERRDRDEYLYARYISKSIPHELMKLGKNFSQPPGSVHWSKVYDEFVDVIYGHDVQSFTEPVIRVNDKGGRTIGIDTGACFGGRLTCLVFNTDGTEEFHFVQAKKAWKEFRIVGDKNGR